MSLFSFHFLMFVPGRGAFDCQIWHKSRTFECKKKLIPGLWTTLRTLVGRLPLQTIPIIYGL